VITAWDPRAVAHIADRLLEFSLTCQFELVADGTKFSVMNVYAPCDHARRDAFLSELRSLADLGGMPWLIVGDFNIARFVEDRNNNNFDARAADDLNALIDDLELQELPLLDRRFTWSNGRTDPTLVRLDHALINLPWGERLFNTSLVLLLRNTSDHVASSRAPVSQTFRYERSWAFSADYRATIVGMWAHPQNRACGCAAARLSRSLKWARAASKKWARDRRRPAVPA
jgi:hypothetical protein